MSIRYRGYISVPNQALGARLTGPTALWSVMPSAIAQVTVPEPSALWWPAPAFPGPDGCCAYCNWLPPVGCTSRGRYPRRRIQNEENLPVVATVDTGAAATDVIDGSTAAVALKNAWGQGQAVTAAKTTKIVQVTPATTVTTASVAPAEQGKFFGLATGATVGGLLFGPVGLLIGALVGNSSLKPPATVSATAAPVTSVPARGATK